MAASQLGVEGRVQLLVLTGEDLIRFLDDRRKVLLDGVPEDREIHAEILVNEDIPHPPHFHPWEIRMA